MTALFHTVHNKETAWQCCLSYYSLSSFSYSYSYFLLFSHTFSYSYFDFLVIVIVIICYLFVLLNTEENKQQATTEATSTLSGRCGYEISTNVLH